MRRSLPLPGPIARVLLGLVLLAGLVAYQRLDKDVTLVVDGREAKVSTLASDVRGLLEGEDVRISRWDRVRPAVSTGLADGMRIQVQHAKEIQLVLNGSPQTLHVLGQTVDDVLGQINLRAGKGAYIKPSRGRPIADGTVVEVRQAVSIRLKVGGKTKNLITNAPDVGFLLDSLGVILRRLDELTPAVETLVSQGMEVRVTKVSYAKRTERTEIPFTTEYRRTSDLVAGTRSVSRAGVPGIEEATYRVRLEDGEVASRQALSQETVRKPVGQIVQVGTRSPDTTTGTSSWYHRTGMVAAHKTLPKGTHVKVTNLANGKSVTVVIDDRGPFVNGWIIDLSDDAFAKLAPLSTGIIQVRLEW